MKKLALIVLATFAFTACSDYEYHPGDSDMQIARGIQSLRKSGKKSKDLGEVLLWGAKINAVENAFCRDENRKEFCGIERARICGGGDYKYPEGFSDDVLKACH